MAVAPNELTEERREELIRKMVPMVKRIAYHFMTRLPPSVQIDDLIQAGLIGLMDAISNFDYSLGAQFETYATQRVRGAMLDELRSLDWLPRQARRNVRQIETTITKLEQKFGRQPTERELAEEIGVSSEVYQSMLLDASAAQLLYYEDFSEEDGSGFLDWYPAGEEVTPLRLLEDTDFRRILVEGIDILPEREKMVMALHYEQDLNLKEIGAVLGVSESRVCQLHGQAVARLRARLQDWVSERAHQAGNATRSRSTPGRKPNRATRTDVVVPNSPPGEDGQRESLKLE